MKKLFLLTIAIFACIYIKAQIDFKWQQTDLSVTFIITKKSTFYENICWNFGDGISIYNFSDTITHVYASKGLFKVTLKAYPMPIEPIDSISKIINLNEINGLKNQNIILKTKISPIPFHSDLNFDFGDLIFLDNNSFLCIYTIEGIELKRIKINSDKITVNTANIKNGFYFYKIINDNKIIDSGKIFKE